MNKECWCKDATIISNSHVCIKPKSDYDYMILDLFIMHLMGFNNIDEYFYNLVKGARSFEAIRQCFPNETCAGCGYNLIQD